MNPGLLDRLHDDLAAANYSQEHVRALLGADADDARSRGAFAAARRAVAGRQTDGFSTLIRFFLLGERCRHPDLDVALPSLRATGAIELGLARASGNAELRAALSLNPVAVDDGVAEAPAQWWLISDLDDHLRHAPARPDHVMGVGGATRSLIAMLPPGARDSALDLGTGCGVVALHLALRGPVVATDISERALRFAAANARLNRVEGIEFRHGDLYEPVRDETFDLIASNPPFVVTPRRDAASEAARYEYRDGGLVGDALVERVLRGAPAHLREGGAFICLANWESHWGRDGMRRVSEWLEAAEIPLGSWVIERDSVSPSHYAETWARDGGTRPGDTGFERLLEDWLADFASRRVVSLGLGSVRMQRLPAGATPVHRAEAAGGAYSGTVGADLANAFATALDVDAFTDADVLDTHWIRSDEVSEEREHRPGSEAPRSITLTTSHGIARRVSADPLLAAAVGACDGDLSLAQIVDALAQLLELEADAVAEALVHGVRELTWLGMLAPAPVDRLGD